MRKGGIIAFDNVLQGGRVVRYQGEIHVHTFIDYCSEDGQIEQRWVEGVLAIRKLNEKLSGDPRVTCVMINIGDGYTLATKL